MTPTNPSRSPSVLSHVRGSLGSTSMATAIVMSGVVAL